MPLRGRSAYCSWICLRAVAIGAIQTAREHVVTPWAPAVVAQQRMRKAQLSSLDSAQENRAYSAKGLPGRRRGSRWRRQAAGVGILPEPQSDWRRFVGTMTASATISIRILHAQPAPRTQSRRFGKSRFHPAYVTQPATPVAPDTDSNTGFRSRVGYRRYEFRANNGSQRWWKRTQRRDAGTRVEGTCASPI
jgi:hypothetical protein